MKIGDIIRVEKEDGIVREGVVLGPSHKPGAYHFHQAVCYRKETGKPVEITEGDEFFCFRVTEGDVTGPAEYVTTDTEPRFGGDYSLYVLGHRPEDIAHAKWSYSVCVTRYGWVEMADGEITRVHYESDCFVDHLTYSRRVRDGKLHGKVRRSGERDYTAKKMARKALGLK